jgi:hypothetical protein
MKSFLLLFLTASVMFAQTPLVFFDGNELSTDPNAGFGRWGFTNNSMTTVENSGYTPGTPAIWWETSDWNWQGFEIWREAGVDLSGDWTDNHLEMKVKAPSGINTLAVYLYDFNDQRVGRILHEYDDVWDGSWQHIVLPLDSLKTDADTVDFDQTSVYWVKIEAAYENQTIREALWFDDIWVGKPEISKNMVLFNGWQLGNEVTWEAWGFDNNDFVLAEGEGYTPGSPAILWETSNWDWQGKGFIFNVQDMTYSMTADTLKVKIQAPAGINTLALEFYDVNYYTTYEVARKELSDVVWDGEWKELEIPLSEFTVGGGFDLSQVYEFGIVAADATIPERLLIDDLWIGSPDIPDVDLTPPEAPASINIITEPSAPYINLVIWEDVEGETGESYNVYASMEPITDLNGENVIAIGLDIEEGTQTIAHYLYYPLEDGLVSYYYAVNCKDSYGNFSETFTVTAAPFENDGKGKAIISLDVPENFIPDGDLSEWDHITPFEFKPSTNIYTGSFEDDADLSVLAYVAMDNDYIYVAFDVIDDVFSWAPDNTSNWWDDESIEFYIGLYEYKAPHSGFGIGATPDYRLVFLPDELWLPWDWSSYPNNSDNYYFESFGESDYLLEAKIPYYDMQWETDTTYVLKEGAMIPFELFVADSDVKDGGNEGRLQLGDNALLNPWGEGQKAWGFAWTGMPDFVVSVEETNEVPYSFTLEQNYPNPFNPTTMIKYSIVESVPVELSVYNTLGQKIATLINEVQSAGVYEVTLDASQFASGVYLYSIKAGKFQSTKKMMLLK